MADTELDLFIKTASASRELTLETRDNNRISTLDVLQKGEEDPLTGVQKFFSKSPFYISWRCGGTDYPEFSAPGVFGSLEAGYKALELSLWECASGEFVLSHDYNTLRATGEDHVIFESTWDTLSQVDNHGEKLLRLTDVLDMVGDDIVLSIDPKASSSGGDSAGAIRSESKLIQFLMSQKDYKDRFIWKTFAEASRCRAVAIAAGLSNMTMYYAGETFPQEFNGVDVIGLDYTAPQSYWDILKGTGKPTIGHVVQSREAADMAFQKGARGIMSGTPANIRP